MATSRPNKRLRMDEHMMSDIRAKREAFLSSLQQPVSPPRRGVSHTSGLREPQLSVKSPPTSSESTNGFDDAKEQTVKQVYIRSPIQLLKAEGLPDSANLDTVTLHDILGDPLIEEAWIFNYCFDLDWTMQHFDQDIRKLVKVKVVHGSWMQEDSNKQGIEEAITRTWSNVQSITAYLPDRFGTHHSKMFVLFRRDDTAQVVIHTANMLEKDWHHMTQAVWRSPMLPLLSSPLSERQVHLRNSQIGSGARFKHDLLGYIAQYRAKLKDLQTKIKLYDFRSIRAALVASTPSQLARWPSEAAIHGHESLKTVIEHITAKRKTDADSAKSHLVAQVSSIATLPQGWLNNTIVAATFTSTSSRSTPNSRVSIIFPTPSDMRNAITGYATGGSIHTKAQTPTHLRQIDSLRPMLRHWTQGPKRASHAQRDLIPPHIKTYICFKHEPTTEHPTPDISWALVTSANLSTQAWGTKSKDGTRAQIASYEIGVLVWPELFDTEKLTESSHDDGKEISGRVDGGTSASRTRMIPMFGKDRPDSVARIVDNGCQTEGQETIVGFRMPYDLPLTLYGTEELPWSPASKYTEADRLNRQWPPDERWIG